MLLSSQGTRMQKQEVKIPGVTGKFGPGVQNEAGQRLTEFCQNALVIANTTSNNTRDNSTCGHDQMVNTKIRLIIFFAAEDAQAVYNQQKTRPGRDCGADHQLLIAKFTLKLKKLGKITRLFSMT